MGCLPSKLGDEGAVVAALQNQVRQLQAQLAAGGTYAPPAGPPAKAEVLWFPVAALPCRFASNCRRHQCTYSHQPTAFTRFLEYLNSARSSMDICVFTITCDDISAAVLAAHRRGVRVRIITDNDQSTTQGSDIAQLASAGIQVAMDKDSFHMHHKFCVLDRRIVLNGSFNWTRQAVLNNQENVLVLDHPQLAAQFTQHFEVLWRRYHIGS